MGSDAIFDLDCCSCSGAASFHSRIAPKAVSWSSSPPSKVRVESIFPQLLGWVIRFFFNLLGSINFEFEFLVRVQFSYKLYHFEQNSRRICEVKITSSGYLGYSKKMAKIYLQVGLSFDWNDPTLTSSHTLMCTGHQQSAWENFDPGTCLLKRQFLSMLSKIAVIAQLNCDSKCPNHHHQLFKI